MDQAVRSNALSQAIIDAKEWRETFENEDNNGAVVEFEEVYLRDRVNDSSSHGFEGSLRLPRDIAIEMMVWLEDRATTELA